MMVLCAWFREQEIVLTEHSGKQIGILCALCAQRANYACNSIISGFPAVTSTSGSELRAAYRWHNIHDTGVHPIVFTKIGSWKAVDFPNILPG